MSFARTLIKIAAFNANDPLQAAYDNAGMPGGTVSSIGSALDYIVSSLFPNARPSVADETALPLVGNTINDYRIALDYMTTGQAAGFRWTQLEGQSTPQWNLVQNFDATDSILQQWEMDAAALFVNEDGMPGGQTIHGSTLPNEDLTLSANSGDGSLVPANQTGYINFFGDARPLDDNAYDLGTATERFASMYLAGNISDGVAAVTVANMLTAYNHSQITTGNPHDVAYEEVLNRLGNVTINGDVSTLVVDFSTQGDKDFTLSIIDDSHNHTVSTITDFVEETWTQLKDRLVDTADVVWTFNDTLKTAAADVTVDTADIEDIEAPVVNKILVSSATGNDWIASDGTVELTGDITGLGTYNSSTDKVSIATTGANISLDAIDKINLTNLDVSIAATNPATVTNGVHGMLTGRKIRLFGTTFDNEYTITVIDPNTYTIAYDNSLGAIETGTIIPNGSQLLYDSVNDEYIVQLEGSQLSHYEISDLGGDDHTQYNLINGRTDGTINKVTGGELANGNLYLRSTSNATKGEIRIEDNLVPETGATYSGGWSGTDIGATAKRIRDIFMSGVISNMRVETVGSTPAASAQEKGRLTLLNGGDLFFNKDGVNNRLILDETHKGIANGIVPLNGSTKIESTYLPSYVDDVLEYADLASFPGTGEAGKIYVDLDTGKTYRWSGATYIEISPSEVNSVAGKTGIVTLDTDDVTEATALYFTDGRAQTAAVVNSTAGSETVQAPSVAAMKAYADAVKPAYEQAVPSGPINGVNTSFTIPSNPSESKAVQLYLNGLILRQGIDYTVVGNAITMIVVPQNGQDLYAYYTKA